MLGILMLDTRFPRPVGDVGNPASFAFPVAYRVVRGADPAAVVRGSDPRLIRPFVQAGLDLVREGATALSTSCGFLARWQRELQAALPVPVWSSALLALPALPRPGVITIEAASLTAEHFAAAGADPATPVEGIAPDSPLHRSLLRNLPTLDIDDAQAQVLAAGQRLLARHPGLQSLVLECTNLPPYAPALQAAGGRPVHHIVSLLHQRMRALESGAG
ncbi:MAG: aspartate/glutamate racemase family protein [Rubrivivax sp.]